MRIKFSSTTQIADYTAGDLIECLECGKKFSFLGNHLRRMHGLSCEEYRELWNIPAMTPLAGQVYRALHREKIKRLQITGALTYEHLPSAVAAALRSDKPGKLNFSKNEHSELIAKIRPGDKNLLPPGAKLASGRDADARRIYQQEYRARKKAEK